MYITVLGRPTRSQNSIDGIIMPKNAPPAVPFPEQWLKDQKVCIEGKFTNYPTSSELTKWLKKTGATIVRKLTDEVDLLIVDSDNRNKARSEAKRLNAAGAHIKIVENLRELVVLSEPEHAALINDVEAMRRFQHTTNHPWLIRHDRAINGQTFRETIAGLKGNRLDLQQFLFDNCKLDGTNITYVDFGPFISSLSHCNLHDVNCKDVQFGHVVESQFKSFIANEIEFHVLQDCNFQDATLHNVSIKSLSGCKLTNCELSYSRRARGPSFVKSHLEGCVIANITVGYAHFKETHFKNVTFRNCDFGRATFSTSKLHDCVFESCRGSSLAVDAACAVKNVKFKDCEFSFVDVGERHKQQMTGLDAGPELKPLAEYPFVHELAKADIAPTKLNFTVEGRNQSGNKVTLQMERPWWHVTHVRYTSAERTDVLAIQHVNPGKTRTSGKVSSHSEAMTTILRVFSASRVTELDAATITSKTSKCPLKPKELRRLIVDAVYEVIGAEAPDEQEIAAEQKRKKTAANSLKKSVLEELQSANVKAFNRRTKTVRQQAHPFREKNLSGLKLAGVNLSDLDLMDCDLSGADLTRANLQNAILRGVNFSGANLTSAKMKGADLRRSDLTDTNLTGVALQGATFGNAKLERTILDGVTFGKDHDLCSVDLSKAILTNSRLNGCVYDRRTEFPPDVTTADLKKMRWADEGVPPHERPQNEKVDEPINFEQFMERLNEITDSSRLKKVTKMLKAESFQLFSEVTNSSVSGVVKSQTDKDLVYSCSLDADGRFTCCTQNLRSCGGLRGALCKHILVLVVGLTKSEVLNANVVDEWINSSRMRHPELDKDAMSEILLRYKGAEAGEIDWRPTETVPEDFFAF